MFMKRISILALSMGLCAASAQNTLTPKEAAEGFQLLFDGRTLGNFDVAEGQKIWSVVNGAIKSNSNAGAGNLLTKDEFANFVLKSEFRADPELSLSLSTIVVAWRELLH